MPDCLDIMLCRHYIKHATLINSCYPDRENEQGPRSSELSYLTFYASSRPVKLTKVGHYLEKRVDKDIRKGRRQNNHVSLSILKALIQTCHRDLNLFSTSIVNILSMILDTRDLELIDLTCETFIVFCDHHDGTTLGVDTEFTAEFEALIQKFTNFCSYMNTDEALVFQMQYIGFRSLQAHVTSRALYASDFQLQLNTIVPPHIARLSTSKTPIHRLITAEPSVDIRKSVKDTTIDSHTIDVLAVQTMAILYAKPNGATIRPSLKPLLTFFDTKDKWWPPQFAVSLMTLVLNSLQPQHRYLLVSEILHPLDFASSSMAITKQASLASILDCLLNAKVSLVGLSVLEMFHSIFSHLIQWVQRHGLHTTAPDSFSSSSSQSSQSYYAYITYKSLSHCICGLVSHTYYQNQQSDMISYLVSKLKASTGSDTMHGLALDVYQPIVLECLENVIDHSHHPTAALSTWSPSLGLLADPSCSSPTTRLWWVRLLRAFMGHSLQQRALRPWVYQPMDHEDIGFMHALHQTMAGASIRSLLTPADGMTLYRLLCLVTCRYGDRGTVETLPLVFELEAYAQQQMLCAVWAFPYHQRAMASLLVQYCKRIGEYHDMQGLVEYMVSLEKRRRSSHQHSTLVWTDEGNKEETLLVWGLQEQQNTTPVEIWMDRAKVVRLMLAEGSLQEWQAAEEVDLEHQLLVEWSDKLFLNHERAFRISVPQKVEDLKPHLTTPWTSTQGAERDSQEETQPVKVENLKEALAAQTSGSESDERDTDSMQSLPSVTSPQRPIKGTRKDMEFLLTELKSSSPSAQSSVSLVKPPYKL
ncbi:hypothetical protein BDF14DRAFT_1794620 [Spinellus fusiger]|nr:hypothetical protein BDF14DRAFT_1794620 [Spinellus fusiger]